MFPLLLLIVPFLVAFAFGDNSIDQFSNPAPAPNNFATRSFPTWTNGTSQTLTWSTDFDTITIVMEQNITDSTGFAPALELSNVGQKASDFNGKMDWTVLIPSYFDLSKSNVAFFLIYNGSCPYNTHDCPKAFESDYIILAPPTSGLSQSAKTGLGVGFGLGIPILLVAGFFYLRWRRLSSSPRWQ